jgi:hypothetical protein
MIGNREEMLVIDETMRENIDPGISAVTPTVSVGSFRGLERDGHAPKVAVRSGGSFKRVRKLNRLAMAVLAMKANHTTLV